MKDKCDAQDAKKESEAKELEEECKKTSEFNKLMEYNHPKFWIPIGIILSLINGVANPYLGIVFANILTLLTVPVRYLEILDPKGKGGIPYMKEEVIYWVIVCLIVGIITFVCMATSKKIFGTLGNNVTF
jgi:hypothetical protein